MSERPVVYMVCTGNAARSPMAAAMLRALDTGARLEVRSAGTLVLEGHPMGARTRQALARHGLVDHSHRSRQFRVSDAHEADLVVVMEPMHLHWIRKHCPEAAPITGSLHRLARDLPTPQRVIATPPQAHPEGQTSTGDHRAAHGVAAPTLAERVASMGLADLGPEPWEEVVDPAGGDLAAFYRCADELVALIDQLHRRLS